MRFFSLKTGFILALCLFSLAQCRTAKTVETGSDADLKQLLQYMTGDFSSEAQSKRDSDYFDIRLHIYPIWTADKANHWLYVEQATAAAQNKPYRQRVYKVERDGDTGFKSIVYTLAEPAKFVGGYKNAALFDQIKPADLSLREGCTVFLKKQRTGAFIGATDGSGCESTLRGAKYASSKVTITANMLQSWDQGFNEKGEQVWGATKGGYEFIKQ
jgi:CpeT protein